MLVPPGLRSRDFARFGPWPLAWLVVAGAAGMAFAATRPPDLPAREGVVTGCDRHLAPAARVRSMAGLSGRTNDIMTRSQPSRATCEE